MTDFGKVPDSRQDFDVWSFGKVKTGDGVGVFYNLMA